ncbi:MAG: UvrD-helicase domain-containing protein, partial [Clostridia bacterium]|nr:UvrD-helicase domain-containing protein [Clostridia bacterium]
LNAELEKQGVDAEVEILPGIGSLSYFCAKLGRTWQDVKAISLHGRQTDLVRCVKENPAVFTLLGGETGALDALNRLKEAGLGALQAHIGQRLGYENEEIVSGTVAELAERDYDSLSVLRTVARALKLDEKKYPLKMLRARISDAKNRLLNPKEWLEESEGDDFSQNVYQAYTQYEKALRENNALDFDDLLVKTLTLLVEHPPVLEYYSDRFEYIMVDEYQDTNRAQYELVSLLARRRQNLCVVGDDDQSIYGWRGADIRIILNFESDFPNAKVIKLEQNYRSTGNILDAANQVIAHNRGRKEKALWTQSDEGARIALYNAMDEREEASFVVRMANKRIGEGTKPGGIAVLYRTNAQSRVLEEAFVRSGIPYRVYGGLRFYERKEVKDLLGYMRAIANPMDDVALRRIINEPKRGIGESTVEALQTWATEHDDSLFNAVLDAEQIELTSRAQKAVGGFSALLMELSEAFYALKPSEFLEKIIERTGYVDQLKKSDLPEDKARLENIQELQGAVSEFERLTPEGTVSDYLEQAALMTDTDSLDERQGMVTLMTLHSAKGLEFDIVFLPGMEENIFPLTRAQFDETQMEEERRLAYVGITRAKKELILSHARNRMLYNNRQMNPVSRFVEEIPQRLIRSASSREETRRAPLPYGTRRQSVPTEGRTAYGGALGISGVRKGFGEAKVVQSAARRVQGVQLFRAGDSVVHRTFGAGKVTEVFEDNGEQKVRVDFGQRGERVFNASIAPIIKVGG